MADLGGIKTSVQQVAEAIGIALKVEVEIVDSKLNIVGGTGIYQEMLGKKEEEGNLSGNYLYARTLRTGKTQYVADAVADKNYDEKGFGSTAYGECAEICTPVVLKGMTIGIIGLVAFNEEQRSILVDRGRNMIGFIERMADLLAAKAEQQEALENVEESRDEMSTVLETTHEGIFSLDRSGYVKHCNVMAATLLRTTKKELIGTHISKLMPKSPAMKVMETGRGYTENEEIFRIGKEQYHFIITVKPYMKDDEVQGIVVSFRDIEEAQKLVYNFNNRTIKNTVNDIVGSGKKMMDVKRQALLIARGNSGVLVSGEKGVGKEMFAKAIHYASSRADNPFVTVSCSAIPENLIESEIFGVENEENSGKGSVLRAGKIEQANEGTIFIDEISEVPAIVQMKLHKLMQTGRFVRVGGTREVPADVRIIAATAKNPEKLLRSGLLREDLYYKLSVLPLEVPPLRSRKEDIRPLMRHFLNKYNAFASRKITGFSREVEELYGEYDWPGNVSELENAVEYGINMAFGNTITMEDVPSRILKKEEEVMKFNHMDEPLSVQVKHYEREIIRKKLKQHGGVKDVVAKELGLSRATLYRKLSELDID